MEILFLITICTVIVIFSQVLDSNVGISFYVGTVGAGILVDFGLCMVGMCMGDVVYNYPYIDGFLVYGVVVRF